MSGAAKDFLLSLGLPENPSFEQLTEKMRQLARDFGDPALSKRERIARADDIIGRLDRLRGDHNPAALSQSLALADQWLALVSDLWMGFCPQPQIGAAWRVAITAMFEHVLAAAPETPPAPVIRPADHRKEIRESRAYEATTGPPR